MNDRFSSQHQIALQNFFPGSSSVAMNLILGVVVVSICAQKKLSCPCKDVAEGVALGAKACPTIYN